MAQVLGKRVDREERFDAVKIPARTKKSPRFLFRHHPFRWMFVGGEWLPQLGKLRIDPGVGGVAEGGGIDLAVAGGLRRGWQVIQPSDPRLGQYQDYLVAYPHAAGGNTYLDPFQKVSVEAGRLFVDGGGEDYYKFLRHLISSGIVAPITATHLYAFITTTFRPLALVACRWVFSLSQLGSCHIWACYRLPIYSRRAWANHRLPECIFHC